MSGLGCGERGADRVQVTHLPDHNHIRVVAQGVYYGAGKRFGVVPQVALPDNTFFITEKPIFCGMESI